MAALEKTPRPGVTYSLAEKEKGGIVQHCVMKGNRVLSRHLDADIARKTFYWLFDRKGTPDPVVVGYEFARVLKEWIKDPAHWDGEYAKCKSAKAAWGKMCADNARLHAEGSTCCASHDWCDANMAMDEAFRNLHLDPLPFSDVDRPDKAQEAAQQAAADLWNAAWTAAGPWLRGEKEVV